jgi:chemotaxis protein MotB
MRRSSKPFLRLCDAALPCAAALLAAGCVTSGKYDRVVAERDALRTDKAQLEERVRLLEASTKSLDAERASLIDQMEDLRQEQETLQANLVRLRKKEAELSESLTAREAELASRGEELQSLRSTYQGLVSDLEAELAAGQIEIRQLREGLQLNMSQEVLFASGSAEVSRGGQVVLAKVAERVRGAPYQVVVQGHTDDVPIATERFPSNWELAGARASRVVRILAKDGVPGERLSAVSFGEYSPRASNDTEAGRARNRRIEITLKPLTSEAVAASSPDADAGAEAQPGGAAAAQQQEAPAAAR